MSVAQKVRYVGLQSKLKGKSLFEIAAKLKTCKGRVVYRNTHLKEFPEKTYCILDRVIPDLKIKNFGSGTAYGIQIYRGNNPEKVTQISSAFKKDWWLVPKDEEEEFCKIDKVYHPRIPTVLTMDVPPLMSYLLQNIRTTDLMCATTLPLNMRKQSKRKILAALASKEQSSEPEKECS